MKLDRFFGGVETLDKLPSMVFIADLSGNEYAAREAKQKSIPVMAFLNTDTNPTLVNHPIPGNDRNTASVKLLMEFLAEAAAEGKKEALLRRDDTSKAEVKQDEAQNAKTEDVITKGSSNKDVT